MKTLVGRTPRVLLVAAMSTSALVSATATASAHTCDPASAECDDAAAAPSTIPSTIATFTDRVTVIHEHTRTVAAAEPEKPATLVRLLEKEHAPALKPLEVVKSVEPVQSVRPVEEDACGSLRLAIRAAFHRLLAVSDAVRTGEPSIVRVLDTSATTGECPSPLRADPVNGTDLALAIGPAIDAETPAEVGAVVAAPETTAEAPAELAGETTAESAGETTADAGVTTKSEGGVAVEDTVVEERVAPEQMEVVGPQATVTGALPQTGYDGSVLTLLGLALIASGAAVRSAARD